MGKPPGRMPHVLKTSTSHAGGGGGVNHAHQVCKFPNLMPIEGGVSARALCDAMIGATKVREGRESAGTRRDAEGGGGALLVGQADLEVVEVGALELFLDLVEGVLDLLLEAIFIIMAVVLDPVAVAVGLMRMRHGQGGGGADQLREQVGDLRAKGKGRRRGEQRRERGACAICR